MLCHFEQSYLLEAVTALNIYYISLSFHNNKQITHTHARTHARTHTHTHTTISTFQNIHVQLKKSINISTVLWCHNYHIATSWIYKDSHEVNPLHVCFLTRCRIRCNTTNSSCYVWWLIRVTLVYVYFNHKLVSINYPYL